MKPEKKNTGTANDLENTNPLGICLDGKIIVSPVVSCRIEGDDGALLFNADTDNTLLINPSGIVIWNFISQPRTVEEIVEYITKFFANSPDHASVRKDIETFVTDLAPDFVSEV
ncbi:MAG: PqqD family peptide modification chaperone [Methanoregula sp.]|nr:PqqD family peptide modification chaperone [Methanoregula sp.]